MHHGANPNKRSHFVKSTPLHWLAFYGDWRAIRILLAMNKPSMVETRRPNGKFGILGELNTENTFHQLGAFNAFHQYDYQTPIDIAGDLKHLKSVRVMLQYFIDNE